MRRTWTALAIGACVLVMPVPATAAKKIGAGDLAKIQVVNQPLNIGQGQVMSGTAACPKGARVISGGVFFTPTLDQAPVATDDTRVRASLPAENGKSWYGAGENQAGGQRIMYVTAHCLLKSKKNSKKIGGNDLAKYKPESGGFTVSAGETKGRNVECGDDARVMAAGAYLNSGSGQPNPADDFVLSQMSAFTLDFVYGAGRSLVAGTQQGIVRALCLPETPKKSNKIGGDDLKRFEIRAASFPLVNNQIDGGYALCEDGERIITGGSFLQTPGGASAQDNGAAIAGTSAAGGGNAWYAATRNLSGTQRMLVVSAICLPR